MRGSADEVPVQASPELRPQLRQEMSKLFWKILNAAPITVSRKPLVNLKHRIACWVRVNALSDVEFLEYMRTVLGDNAPGGDPKLERAVPLFAELKGCLERVTDSAPTQVAVLEVPPSEVQAEDPAEQEISRCIREFEEYALWMMEEEIVVPEDIRPEEMEGYTEDVKVALLGGLVSLIDKLINVAKVRARSVESVQRVFDFLNGLQDLHSMLENLYGFSFEEVLTPRLGVLKKRLEINKRVAGTAAVSE